MISFLIETSFLIVGFVLVLCLVLPMLLQDFLIIPALKKKRTFLKAPPTAIQYWVRTTDGKLLECWGLGLGPPLIVFHGNSDNLETFWERQQRFAQLGFTVYVFDYRGIGYSTGWPSEKGLYLDAEAVIAFVAEKHQVRCQEIVLIGISLGTGPASYLIAKCNTKRAVLFSPYLSIREVVSRLRFFSWYLPTLKYELANHQYLKQRFHPDNDPASVLVLHSKVDELIPFEHGQELCRAVSEKHNCEVVEHASSTHHETVENLWEELVGWLQVSE